MTVTSPVHAWVAGGTGLVGSALLAHLRGDNRIAAIDALCRQPPAQAEAKIDWRPWAWLEQAPGATCDVAFCCLGTTHKQAGSREAFAAVDRDLVLHFAECAKQAGALRFGLISSVGASPRARSHYMRVKGEVEARLGEMGFDALHIVQPSLLLGQRKDARVAEDLAQRCAPLIGGLMRGPLSLYRPVPAEKVARCLLEATLEGEPGAHLHYPWASDTSE